MDEIWYKENTKKSNRDCKSYSTIDLRLRSHGNDIVPLSYRSDFWNGKVDCSHGSGPLSYQFWDLFTRVRYRIVPKHFAPKQAKKNLICQQIRVISI